MIDVPCPQCGMVYHADIFHLGKRIKCSRCGSLVPILEAVKAVVPSCRPVDVVRPAVSAQFTRWPGWLMPVWAVGVVCALILGALSWLLYRRGNSETVPPKLGGSGTLVHRAPDAATSSAPKTANEFQDVELDPFDSKLATPKGPDLAPSRKLEERPKVYQSLATGTRFCVGTRTTGNGVLKVDNGTSEDAALRLYDVSTEQIVRCLFVKARDALRVKGIPEGIYGLKYTTGIDWQDNEEAFRWHPSYSRFDRLFVFSEERVGEKIQYHEIEVTLQPVIGGNVRAVSISREEFLTGGQDASLQR